LAGDEANVVHHTAFGTATPDEMELGLDKGYTVLVVEDVDINREIVGVLLESTGIQIEYAFNGEQAVQMFSDASGRYDMIFMDVQMPGMDGITATRLIRELGKAESKSIPIVAMTANVFRDDIDRCIEAGMNDHLSKPLDYNQIIAKLRQYLLGK
jgi:CheY-like chemotaxis protein